MLNAEALAVLRIEGRAAIFALDHMIGDHAIAIRSRFVTSLSELDMLAPPACPVANLSAPCSMLWRQQFGISLLGNRHCYAQICLTQLGTELFSHDHFPPAQT